MMQGAIFDMDGTLLDSMLVWDQLSQRFLGQFGIQVTKEDYSAIEGTTQLQGARYFAEKYPQIPLTPEGIVDGLNQIITKRYEQIAKPKEGIVRFLEGLRAKGIPCSIATLTARHHAEKALRDCGMWDYFDFMLTIEDVGVSKRDPAIYLQAAEKMGCHAGQCMVFEDAPYAAETAKKAGFLVCGVLEPAYAAGQPLLQAVSDMLIENSYDEIEAHFSQTTAG